MIGPSGCQASVGGTPSHSAARASSLVQRGYDRCAQLCRRLLHREQARAGGARGRGALLLDAIVASVTSCGVRGGLLIEACNLESLFLMMSLPSQQHRSVGRRWALLRVRRHLLLVRVAPQPRCGSGACTRLHHVGQQWRWRRGCTTAGCDQRGSRARMQEMRGTSLTAMAKQGGAATGQTRAL